MGTDASFITDFDNKKVLRVIEVAGVVNHPNEGSYVVDVDGKKALAIVVLDGGGGGALELYLEKPNAPTVTTPTIDNTLFMGDGDTLFLDDNNRIGFNSTALSNSDLPPNMTATDDSKYIKMMPALTNKHVGLFLRSKSNEDIGLDAWSSNNNGNTFLDHRWTGATNSLSIRVRTAGVILVAMQFMGDGTIRMPNTPTASAGLASDTIWSDAGSLKIIP